MKKYHFFWGGIYSNWYKASFNIKMADNTTITFNCAEQYMMYCKAILSNDNDSVDAIMATSDPKKQKALGRKVKNFNSVAWDNLKEAFMTIGITEKFKQNPELLEQLLAEDCELFVEASPHDRIWGIGYAADNALENINDWGENLLGKITTNIRNTIRNENSGE